MFNTRLFVFRSLLIVLGLGGGGWGGGKLCEIHNLKYSHKKKSLMVPQSRREICTVTMTSICSASPSYTQYGPHKQSVCLRECFSGRLNPSLQGPLKKKKKHIYC